MKNNAKELANKAIDKEWKLPKNQLFLKSLIKKYGKYKKIVYAPNGKAYRVPTKLIITEGIKGKDITKFPLWEE